MFESQINNLASVTMVINKDFHKHDLKAREGDLVRERSRKEREAWPLFCEGRSHSALREIYVDYGGLSRILSRKQKMVTVDW